jgi:UDP-N-acetylmuramyl pentapeptide phosphotransferase/UDP-N-acetylglucosamine-1-phosphate transferase
MAEHPTQPRQPWRRHIDGVHDTHDVDPLSLGAGLVFLAVALVVLSGGGDGLVDNGGWLVPVVLVVLGLLGVASGRHDRRS